jgi:hypothetical protein
MRRREKLFRTGITRQDRRMDCAVIYSEAALADLQEITAFIAASQTSASISRRDVDLGRGLPSAWCNRIHSSTATQSSAYTARSSLPCTPPNIKPGQRPI